MDTELRVRYVKVISRLCLIIFVSSIVVLPALFPDIRGAFPGLPPVPDSILTVAGYGIFNSWGIGGLVAGIWMGGHFLSILNDGGNIRLIFGVFSGLFIGLPIMAIFMVMGTFFGVPYAIYNAIILKRKG
jgi:hypothetical protein